jgi:uncharacterized protein YqhQ
VSEKEKKLEMGGQAVIEGVMMRSPTGYTIAVRKKDKSIKIKSVPYIPLTKKFKILSLPFIRGIITLFEMLVIGMKGLDFSANEWDEVEDEKKDAEKNTQESDSAELTDNPDKKKIEEDTEGDKTEDKAEDKAEEKRQLSPVAMTLMIMFSLSMALIMTVVIPNVLTHLLGMLPFFKTAGQEAGASSSSLVESRSPLLFNLISGLIRAMVLLTYIWVVSLSKDIRRVFEYHGAEHKAVFAYENRKDLTLDNVRPYGTRHPRCGTTFLGVVIMVSIVVFAFLAKLINIMYPGFLDMNIFIRKIILIFTHILFMPFVAGVSYEVIKYGAKHLTNPLTRLMTYPGLLSQYLTTKEPDDEQLEVSILSLKAAMAISPDQKEIAISVISPEEIMERMKA